MLEEENNPINILASHTPSENSKGEKEGRTMKEPNKEIKENLPAEAELPKDSIKTTEFISWIGILAIFIVGLIIGGFITWFVITPREIEIPVYILNESYKCEQICTSEYPELGVQSCKVVCQLPYTFMNTWS